MNEQEAKDLAARASAHRRNQLRAMQKEAREREYRKLVTESRRLASEGDIAAAKRAATMAEGFMRTSSSGAKQEAEMSEAEKLAISAAKAKSPRQPATGGGMTEVELPDGTILEFPGGMTEADMLAATGQYWSQQQGNSTTEDERRKRLKLRQMQAQARQGGVSQPQNRGFWHTIGDNVVGFDDGVQSYGEDLGTWLSRAGETMTMGLLGDEGSAAVYAPAKRALAAVGMGGDPNASYEGELDRFRQNEANMSGMGKLSADLTGAVLPALAGVGAVGQAATWGGRALTGAGLGAGAGFTQGFMEGEEGFSNRMASGALGGAVGALLGGAMPIAAEAGRSGVRAVSNAMRNRNIGQGVGRTLGVRPETARVLTELVGGDDQVAMTEALRRAGPDAMLADASPAMGGVLDATMRSPVPGARTAQQRVSGRAGAAYDNVMDAISPMQGPKQSVRGSMDAIRTGTAGARKSAYDAAYSMPINYAEGPGARLLDDVSPRLPQEAVSYANRLMRLNGEKSAQIMADIADDGSVSFTRPPDVRQWDYIKQALDQLAESGDGAGALGGQTRMGMAYQNLAREVRDNVAEAVPEYRTALDTASDAISRRSAVQFGSELLSPKITTDEALERIATATGPERAAMMDGMRGQLSEVIGNVKAVASDQNIDARQALDAYKRLSSPNAKLKMEALFGDAWPTISQELDRAGSALGLRARTAANSATAGRLFANDLIEEVTEPGALRKGQPLKAAKSVIGGVTGASPEAVRGLRDRTKSELAELLTRQDGTPGEAVQAVIQALAENPINMNSGANTALGIGLTGAGAVPVASSQIIEFLMQPY